MDRLRVARELVKLASGLTARRLVAKPWLNIARLKSLVLERPARLSDEELVEHKSNLNTFYWMYKNDDKRSMAKGGFLVRVVDVGAEPGSVTPKDPWLQANLQNAMDETDKELKKRQRGGRRGSRVREQALDGQRIARELARLAKELTATRYNREGKKLAKKVLRAARDLIAAEDDACGEKGCIRNVGGKWKVMSGKTGKYWPASYPDKKSAQDALDSWHASRFKGAK